MAKWLYDVVQMHRIDMKISFRSVAHTN